MRMAIYGLAVVQVPLLLVVALGSGGSDPSGNALTSGFAALGVILLIMFLMPAVFLARAGKALPLALGLTILPLVLMAIVRTGL